MAEGLSKYKGEIANWADVPVGSPVELMPEALRHIRVYAEPMTYTPEGTYKTLSTSKFGIMTSQEYVQFYLGEGELTSRAYGVLRSEYSKVKILTGTLGQKIKHARITQLQERPESFYSNAIFPFSGTDPEIFGELNGQIVPAWEYLASEKENHSTFWDGFQAEFTTKAESCLELLQGNVRAGLVRVREALRNKFPKAELSAKSTWKVPKDVLAGLPEKYVQFGCRPSLNAYGDTPVQLGDPKKVELRTAGGHVHFGQLELLGYLEESALAGYVRWIDAFAGVAMVGLMDGLDDPERRKYYGRAGEFRKTPYGLEYRVLSNGWLRHPALYHLAFELCRIGLNLGHKPEAHYLWKTTEGEVRECINSSDAILARKIIERNEKVFKAWVGVAIQAGQLEDNAKSAYRAVMDGIGTHLQTPEDITKNWGIRSGDIFSPYEGKKYKWSLAAKSVLQNTKI